MTDRVEGQRVLCEERGVLSGEARGGSDDGRHCVRSENNDTEQLKRGMDHAERGSRTMESATVGRMPQGYLHHFHFWKPDSATSATVASMANPASRWASSELPTWATCCPTFKSFCCFIFAS